MITTNRFFSTLDSLAKLATNTNSSPPETLPALPSLNAVLAEFSPLPRAALFLGLANDGLPILLNLLDPLPGPILIAGDEKSGKTNFIRTMASSVDRGHPSSEVKYVIITNNLSEWRDFQHSRNCENILSAEEAILTRFLHSMVDWAHANKGGRQVYLLLIDHFESLIEFNEVRQDLSWLLLRGPARRVWPVVTVGSSQAVSSELRPWLNSFRTRLFGHIQNDRESQWLTGSPEVSFAELGAGVQFAMREGNGWLQFWIPKLD
jgi:hypothetical protein